MIDVMGVSPNSIPKGKIKDNKIKNKNKNKNKNVND